MKKILFSCILFLGFVSSAFSQNPKITWSKEFNFGGNFDDVFGLSSDEDIYVSGYQRKYFSSDSIINKGSVKKFLGSGDIVWSYLADSSQTFSGYGAILLKNSSVYFKYTDNLIKIGEEGNMVLKKAWNNSFFNGSVYGDSILCVLYNAGKAEALIMDTNFSIGRRFFLPQAEITGGVLNSSLTGNYLYVSSPFYQNNITNTSSFIAKYDIQTNSLLWRFNLSDGIRSFSAVDSLGNSYLASTRVTNDPRGYNRFFLAKFNTNGTELWRKEWFGRESYETNWENWVNGIAVSSSKKIVVVCGSVQKGNTHSAEKSCYVAGFNSENGDSLFVMKWEFALPSVINSIQNCLFDKSDNLILVGKHTTPTFNKLYIQKYSFPEQVNFQTNAGWNLVSVPIQAQSMKKDSLFANTISQAFAFNGSYYPISDLLLGVGYWLKFQTNQNNTISGQSQNPLNILVNSGWNMIGSTNKNVSSSVVSSNPPGIIASQFFGYNNGYYPSDSIETGKGYWVKTNSSGNLILTTTGLSKNKIIDYDSFDKITFENESGKSDLFLIPDIRQISTDEFEMPPNPPSNMQDVRFETNKFVEKFNSWHSIILQGFDYVKMTFHSKQNNSLSLKTKAKEIVLKNGESFDFSGKKIEVMNFNNNPPQKFELYQNYPNPFNPVTKIGYQIPKNSLVSLKVFDILGSEIAVLVNEEKPTGNYEVEFNASKLTSGVYFFQLRAGDFIETKKMILMK